MIKGSKVLNGFWYKVLFVVFVEIYSVFLLFICTPLLASRVSSWVWIAFLALFLITGHFAACYLMRRENPLIWFAGIPVYIIAICIFAQIKNGFFVYSLGLYGIYSRYADESDIILTYIPYYVDSLIFGTLISAGRILFASPTYYITITNDLSRNGEQI